jgi:hypothetical protein
VKKKADFTWPFECADDKNLFPLRPTHPIREIDDVRNGSAEHDNIDVICNELDIKVILKYGVLRFKEKV